MSMQHSVSKSHTIAGVSFDESIQLESDAAVVHKVDVNIAHAGSLGTRTDNDDGIVIITDSGHGITTANTLDVYWDIDGVSGHRRGVTVSAVVGQNVTITGGLGDNLPAQASAVVVCIPMELDLNVDGDNIVGLFLGANDEGQVVLMDDEDAEALFVVLGEGFVWDWVDGNGEANPVAGKTLTKAVVSHKNTTAVTEMRVAVPYMN